MKRITTFALIGWAGIMALGWCLADGRARRCPDTYNCAANELGTRDAYLIAGLLVPFLIAVLLAILNARSGAPLIDQPRGTSGLLLTHNKPKWAYRRAVPWRLIIPAEPRARAPMLLLLPLALILLVIAVALSAGLGAPSRGTNSLPTSGSAADSEAAIATDAAKPDNDEAPVSWERASDTLTPLEEDPNEQDAPLVEEE